MELWKDKAIVVHPKCDEEALIAKLELITKTLFDIEAGYTHEMHYYERTVIDPDDGEKTIASRLQVFREKTKSMRVIGK